MMIHEPIDPGDHLRLDAIGNEIVGDRGEVAKSEEVWGKPLTTDDVLTTLNIIRLWSSEQVPNELSVAVEMPHGVFPRHGAND